MLPFGVQELAPGVFDSIHFGHDELPDSIITNQMDVHNIAVFDEIFLTLPIVTVIQ